MADISSGKPSLSNINHFSDDLLVEIFIRLPFRSIAGCKCTSKRWLDLISSPIFIQQFITRQNNLFNAFLIFLTPHELMLGFITPDDDPPLIPDLGLSPDILVKGNVCGCSNGLLLCCNTRYTTGNGYSIYNPLTKQCTQIAPSPANQIGNLYAVGFVCDPFFGLSREVVAAAAESLVQVQRDRSFRVVIIRSFIRRSFEFEVSVFESETGTWEQTVVTCPDGFAFAPHWLLSVEYEGFLYFMGRTGIFVFDPYSKESDVLDYPDDADSMNIMSFGFLGTCCGRLRIADIGLNYLTVWELIENDYWDLVHTTNLSTKLPDKFCNNYYKRVAGFHPYDGDIVYLHSYADGVFVANLGTDEFEAIPGYEKSDISPFQLVFPL